MSLFASRQYRDASPWPEAARALQMVIHHHAGTLLEHSYSEDDLRVLRDILGSSSCYCDACQAISARFWEPKP